MADRPTDPALDRDFARDNGWDADFETYSDFDLPTYVGPTTFMNLPWITDPAELRRLRVTTLTALGERVVFNDNKEGVIGMRVTRALEQPAAQPDVFTDASGKASATKVLDNTRGHRAYTSSEGLKGDAVWGTRGRWTMLTGTVESEAVTLVMLDHPSNPGFPTYWHARGYGLFAANPMGEKVFTEGKKELNVTNRAGQVDRVPPSHPDSERPGPSRRGRAAVRAFTGRRALLHKM